MTQKKKALSGSFIKEQQAIIDEKIKELGGGLRKFIQVSKEGNDMRRATDPGDVDAASFFQAESVRIAAASLDANQLNALIAARIAITEGVYGVCIECGESISEKRLKAMPSASRCLACEKYCNRK